MQRGFSLCDAAEAKENDPARVASEIAVSLLDTKRLEPHTVVNHVYRETRENI